MCLYVIKMSTGCMPAQQRSAVGFMGGNIRDMGYVLACTNCHYLVPVRASVFKRIQIVMLIINYDNMIHWIPNFVVVT